MTNNKVTALSSLFRYNKTIDYYIRSQYQVGLGQISRSSYSGIYFLGSN